MGVVSDTIHSIGEATGLNDIVDAVYNPISDAVHAIGEATGLDKIGDAIGDSPVLKTAAIAIAMYYGMPWLAEQIGASLAGYTATTATTIAEAEASLNVMASAIAAGTPPAAAAASASLSWTTIASGVAAVAGVASGTLTGEAQAKAIKGAAQAQLDAAITAEEKNNARALVASIEMKGASDTLIKALQDSTTAQYTNTMTALGANSTLINNALATAQTAVTTGFNQQNQGFTDARNAINTSVDKATGTLIETYNDAMGAVNAGANTAMGAVNAGANTAMGAVNAGANTAMGAVNTAYTDAKGEIAKGQAAIDTYRASISANKTAMLANNDQAIGIIGEQMKKWDNVFGPVLDNLSSFYTNLTAQKVSGQKLTIQAQEFQTVKDNLLKNFAQRGIVAGAQQSMMTQAELDNARARSTIRANAPFDVAKAQTEFMGISQNAVNPLTGMMADALTNKNNTLANAMSAEGTALTAQVNQGNIAAGLATGYGTNMANIATGQGNSIANIATGQGNSIANIATGQGNSIANIATGQGNSIANIATGQGNNLANIATGQGNNLANIATGQGNNLANLATGHGNNLANLATGQGTNLANIATGQGNAAANYGNTMAGLSLDGANALAGINTQIAGAGNTLAAGNAGIAQQQFTTDMDILRLKYNTGEAGTNATLAAQQNAAAMRGNADLVQANTLGKLFGSVINLGLNQFGQAQTQNTTRSVF